MTYARRRSERGFTTMMVVVMIMLLAGTTISMSLVFAAQARRTRATRIGGQLRQLLAAAIPIARDQAAARGTAPRRLDIPTPVANAQLSLTFSAPPAPQAGSDTQVLAIATDGTIRASEQFTLHAIAPGHWAIQDVHLLQTP